MRKQKFDKPFCARTFFLKNFYRKYTTDKLKFKQMFISYTITAACLLFWHANVHYGATTASILVKAQGRIKCSTNIFQNSSQCTQLAKHMQQPDLFLPFIVLCHFHPTKASGNNVTGTKIYTLGQSMYFEASVLYTTASSRNKRLYINKCFMTPSSNPDSNPKYTVVDNNG